MPKKTKIPRFQQEAPPEYATHNELAALGLKPTGNVVGILERREGKDHTSLSALYVLSEAAPLEQEKQSA